jgi:serine protease
MTILIRSLFLFSVFFSITIAQQQQVLEKNGVYYLANTIVIKLTETPLIVSAETVTLPEKVNNYLSPFRILKAAPFVSSPSARTNSLLNKYVVVTYGMSVDPSFLAKKVSGIDGVEWAEPKFVYELALIPNDPSLPQQWYLTKIQAQQAWDLSTGDTSIVIGIIDTGVDWDHPDLAANIWRNWGEIPDNGIDDDGNGFIDDYIGWDFGGLTGIADNNPMEDRPDHGTHVAGIASAVTNNGIGVASIGFNSKIMAVKTSQDNLRNAQGQALIAYGYEGIIYAAENGANVVNLSWGGSGFSLLAQDVINIATAAGVLVVAASGNNNLNTAFYPASYNNVLSVASTDQGDLKSGFSNYGPTIDVSSPGSSLYNTWQNNTYATLSGTSMASPLVAGLAGLVFARFPNLNNIQVGEQIRTNVDDISAQNPSFANFMGKGRINAFKALNNTNSISVRNIDVTFSDELGNNDGIIQSGETITVRGRYVNYLAPTTGLNIYLEALNTNLATVNNAIFSVGAIGTLDTIDHTAGFTFTLSPNVPQNQVVNFRINFLDNQYSDFQLISVIVNPTFSTQIGNDVRMTITSRGTLGFNDYPNNNQGIGFRYLNDQNLLFEGALILGTSATTISDAARSSSGSAQNSDFTMVKPFTLNIPGTWADVQGNTIFNDNNAGTNRLSVTVHLNSFSSAEPPHDNYILLRYDIINTGLTPLSNFRAGLFFDWDLISSGVDDMTLWDGDNNLGYVFHIGGNPDTHVGTALVSDNNHNFYAILNPGGDGGINIYDGFTDAEKWQTLNGGKLAAGAGDISHVISGGPYTIAPGDTLDVAFMVAAGVNLEHLRTTVSAARIRYQQILLSADEETNSPVAFSLSQNYPNPFNPSTVINYSIPSGGIVNLTVYDLLGKVVATLVNEEKPAGLHSVEFNSRELNLSTGVYFYTLKAGGNASTKKLLLLK